jgi:hypothetical protein
MRDVRRQYFGAVFSASINLVGMLPLTSLPARMAHITGVLRPAALAIGSDAVFPELDAAVTAERDLPADLGSPVGLNTIGLLLDRLSILAIKHWNLLHRADSPERAATLRSGPAQEMIEALAASQPGHASYNTKISIHGGRPPAGSFVEAYKGLLLTNLLLWEAQEILYNHDMQLLPDTELRAYITFFSENNLSRNAFMEDADRLFWAGRAKGGALA